MRRVRQLYHQAFQDSPIKAVIMRKCHNGDDGRGSKTVFLTNAPVLWLMQPIHDCDDHHLIENYCIQKSKN